MLYSDLPIKLPGHGSSSQRLPIAGGVFSQSEPPDEIFSRYSLSSTMLMPPKQRRRLDNTGSDSGNVASNGRGRPMKRAAELIPSRKARAQHAELIHKHLKAQKEGPQPRQLSTLESLPVEVFEQIFFHCLELNLPRASPYLARALSRPAIYSALVLFAYYEADSSFSHVETDHFLPAKYRRIIRDERVQLQEGIHRCRWFTLDLFESCLPFLSRLQVVESWRRERWALIDINEQRAGQDGDLPALHDPDLILPSLEDKTQMESYFLARTPPHEYSLEDVKLVEGAFGRGSLGPRSKDGYLPFISTTSSWRGNGKPRRKVRQTVLAVRVLPNCVLQGTPWTEAKVKLLQFIRQGMRYEALDRDLVISPDALFDGMASAIVERNIKALLVLLELHETVVKRPAAIGNGSGSDNRQTYPLPVKLFHLACNLDPSDLNDVQTRMMTLLMRGGVEAIPSDDETVTRWAMHITTNVSSTKAQVSMARWLLSQMEEPRYIATYQPLNEPTCFTTEVDYICSATPSELRWSINSTRGSDVPQ